MLILRTVALGPIYGYGISLRLQQMSRDVVQVQQGSLYPALHRLEKRGLLAATWKASDTGRDAKFYRLTANGSQSPSIRVVSRARARSGGGPLYVDENRGLRFLDECYR